MRNYCYYRINFVHQSGSFSNWYFDMKLNFFHFNLKLVIRQLKSLSVQILILDDATLWLDCSFFPLTKYSTATQTHCIKITDLGNLICLIAYLPGRRHCSVDSSAPSILTPRVQNKAYHLRFYQIIFELRHVEKTKISKKRPGPAHLKNNYIKSILNVSLNCIYLKWTKNIWKTAIRMFV